MSVSASQGPSQYIIMTMIVTCSVRHNIEKARHMCMPYMHAYVSSTYVSSEVLLVLLYIAMVVQLHCST